MSCQCDDRCQCSGNSSGFVFGLILGAFIAAALIILSSKNKEKIIKDIKNRLLSLLDKFAPPSPHPAKKSTSSKISVDIPQGVETLNLTPPKAATHRSHPQRFKV